MSTRSASMLSMGGVAVAGASAAVLFASGQAAWGGAALSVAVIFLAAGGFLLLALTQRVRENLRLQSRNLRQVKKQLAKSATRSRAFESGATSSLEALTGSMPHALAIAKDASKSHGETHQVADLREEITRLERAARQTRSLVKRVQTELGELPYHSAELQRLYARLVPHDRTMPALGGWALTTGTLLQLVNDVLGNDRRRVVVECGSGTSTVWLALALQARGGEGSVVALENDPVFAAQTRRQLEELGVSHRARVEDTPLVDTSVAASVEQPWYDISQVELPDRIDVLFVDGPIGSLGDSVRFPAFPLLAERLADDALVILDDTDRPDEKQIVERWTTETFAGRSLEKASATDRATIMRARRQGV